MKKLNWNLISFDIIHCLFRMKVSIEKVVSPVIQTYKLTPVGITVLFFVGMKSKSTISDINRCLKINQGNLSTLCKKLEYLGFLTRTRDQEDERVVRLELTDTGQEVMKAIQKELCHLEKIMSKLSKEEIFYAIEGLQHFTDFTEKLCDKVGSYSL